MEDLSPFDSLRMPVELACEFFAVFSRFEFALKESGHIRTTRFGRAAPDWDAFAARATLDVPPDSEVAAAIDFLVNEPPQVQTEARTWQAVPLRGETVIGKALDAAQRVRHNLFHGGKHTPHSAPGRDERLVRSALTLLLACVAQIPQVGEAYRQPC